MQFRLRAKQLFLTYPQANDINEDDILHILNRDGAPIYALIAREQHQDGNFHFHCFVDYANIRDIRDERYFDCSGHHPNTQGVRNRRAVISYCKKQGSFTEFGTDSTEATKKEQIAAIASIEELTQAVNRGLLHWKGYSRLRLDLSTFLRDQHALNTKNSLDMHQLRLNSCTIGECITFQFTMKFKAKQLYIFGPPNTGKTSLLQQYNEATLFYAPNNNDWNGFNEDIHKIIVFDEFHGQVPLSTMLQVLQGTKIRLNTKGGSIDKTKNCMCIILSNVAPQRCYTNSEAFITRLFILEMTAYHECTHKN